MLPPLVGADGASDARVRPLRGDLKPALARLGEFAPGQLLVATDFDGTLAPIVNQPQAAAVLPANLATLERLVEIGVHIAVVSGRAQHDLRTRFPIASTHLLGDNGFGDVSLAERRALDRFNSRIGRRLSTWPGVWLEPKPGSSSVHYRGNPQAGPSVSEAVLSLANRFGLVTSKGRMVLEVRPQRSDKANAVGALIAELRPRAVVYAGDDEPDQSVFELLRRTRLSHLAVGVSSVERPPAAFDDCDLVIEGPVGMSLFLRELLGVVVRRVPV